MTNPRALRVADRIQVEVSDLIRRRIRDPRVGFVTVTGVDVSSDLRTAHVWVSTLEEGSLEDQVEILRRAAGFLRSELGPRLSLRHTPELIFRADRSGARGRRVEDLLRRLEETGGTAPPEPDEDEDAPGPGEDDGR